MKIIFLVNGSQQDAMGIRARGLTEYLPQSEYQIKILYREHSKLKSLLYFFYTLCKDRPNLVYVFNIGYAGAGASLLARIFLNIQFIIDTGDLLYELAELTGERSWIERQFMRIMEFITLHLAKAIVVRGTFHQKLLENKGYKNVFHIPDGVDTNHFKPMDTSDIRNKLKLNGLLTIGVMGSIVWSSKLQMCYGWELIEVINLLKDEPIKGIIIGDGSGLNYLREKAQEYGIEDKIIFCGRIPYQDLPEYINLMDICLSTQTNNLVGEVRTTGKLPIYLSCGKYILASKVGDAKLLLPDEMLVDYDGVKDISYPSKIALKIKEILKDRNLILKGLNGTNIAKEKLEYKVLTKKLEFIFKQVV